MNDTEKLLLVGSIPLETSTEVFDMFGAPLAPYLATMPDGEVGHRRHWISRVHFEVLVAHPDLEVVAHPPAQNGVEQLFPRDATESWKFKVRDGVDQVRFGDPGWRLGYARDAIASYFMFKTYKEQGKLPPGMRFQVSMPLTNSVLPPRIFPDLTDLDKIRPGYTEALAAELDKIVEKIPHDELAIQWDCSTEVQDAYGAAGLPIETAIERNVAQVRALSPRVPEGVELGYHFCFGTLGGWPRFAPDDLSCAVELANAFVAESGRQVSWIHLPTLDRSDDAFFAPLANLDPKGARVYLGMIHNMRTFPQRLNTARKFLPNFGLGAYCGLGRTPASELRSILRDHLDAVKIAG